MIDDLHDRAVLYDTHWEEVVELAQRYGFTVSSSNGVALMSSHTTQLESYGKTGYFKIQRSNGFCPKAFGQAGCLTDSGQPALCTFCQLAQQASTAVVNI